MIPAGERLIETPKTVTPPPNSLSANGLAFGSHCCNRSAGPTRHVIDEGQTEAGTDAQTWQPTGYPWHLGQKRTYFYPSAGISLARLVSAAKPSDRGLSQVNDRHYVRAILRIA